MFKYFVGFTNNGQKLWTRCAKSEHPNFTFLKQILFILNLFPKISKPNLDSPLTKSLKFLSVKKLSNSKVIEKSYKVFSPIYKSNRKNPNLLIIEKGFDCTRKGHPKYTINFFYNPSLKWKTTFAIIHVNKNKKNSFIHYLYLWVCGWKICAKVLWSKKSQYLHSNSKSQLTILNNNWLKMTLAESLTQLYWFTRTVPRASRPLHLRVPRWTLCNTTTN